jgi:hypothetical protein
LLHSLLNFSISFIVFVKFEYYHIFKIKVKMTLIDKIIHKVEEQVEKKTHSGQGQQDYGQQQQNYNQQQPNYGPPQQNYVRPSPLTFLFSLLISDRMVVHNNSTTALTPNSAAC